MKIILVDCDGVLLDWEWSFDNWMRKHGYHKQVSGLYSIAQTYGLQEDEGYKLMRMFNDTVYAYKLSPLYDAVKYTKKLHEEFGIVFHVISSIGSDPEIQENRVKNLHNVFGSSMFYRITCLDGSVSKRYTLNEYANTKCLWVEDNVSNALLAYRIGLRPLLMHAHYNTKASLPRVYSWEQIYNMVKKEVYEQCPTSIK